MIFNFVANYFMVLILKFVIGCPEKIQKTLFCEFVTDFKSRLTIRIKIR